MVVISHRGLMDGPDKTLENHPDQIISTIEHGYDCEIDVWCVDGNLYLGHDGPTYKIDISFFISNRNKLWIHCKNLDALCEILRHDLNAFWHEKDKFTLTTYGHIWTYPGNELTTRSVAVLPETSLDYWNKCLNEKPYGVCTDFVNKFVNELKKLQ